MYIIGTISDVLRHHTENFFQSHPLINKQSIPQYKKPVIHYLFSDSHNQLHIGLCRNRRNENFTRMISTCLTNTYKFIHQSILESLNFVSLLPVCFADISDV